MALDATASTDDTAPEPQATSAPTPRPKLEGESFTWEIDRSGYTIDDRKWTAEELTAIYENTLWAMENQAHMVPVCPSHYPADEKMQGVVTALRLKEHAEYPGEVILEADVTLTGELLADFQAGAYPKCSVWVPTDPWVKPDGEKLGPVLRHVAMYGNNPVALPDLKSAWFKNTLSSFARQIKTITQTLAGLGKAGKGSKMKTGTKAAAEPMTVDPEVVATLMESFAAAKAGLDQLGAALEMLTGEAPAGDAAAEEQATTKAVILSASPAEKQLAARIAVMEKERADEKALFQKQAMNLADTEFNRLVEARKVTAGDRENFDLLATKSVSNAVNHFEQRSAMGGPAKVGTFGGFNAGVRVIDPKSAEAEHLKSMYVKNGLSSERAAAAVELAAHNPLGVRFGEE